MPDEAKKKTTKKKTGAKNPHVRRPGDRLVIALAKGDERTSLAIAPGEVGYVLRGRKKVNGSKRPMLKTEKFDTFADAKAKAEEYVALATSKGWSTAIQTQAIADLF